jgi:hypothetical protein
MARISRIRFIHTFAACSLMVILTACGGTATRRAGGTTQNGGGNGAATITTIYAGSSASPKLSAFTVNANGLLTPVKSSPFVSNGVTVDMAITPRFLVIRSEANVTSFTIDAFGNLITRVSVPFTLGATGRIVVDPSGAFLYVAAAETRTISEFALNSTTGLPIAIPGSPISTVFGGTGGTPGQILVTPDGRFLLAAVAVARGGGEILTFLRDTRTGALTLVSQAAFSSPLASPALLAMTPNGSLVFANDVVNNAIDSFSNSNGTLVQLGTVSLPAGTQISDMGVDPSGTFLLASDAANSRMEVLRIGAGGRLTPVTGSPVTLNIPTSPTVIAFVGGFVFIGSDVSQDISAFQLNPDGTLTVVPGRIFPAGLPVTRLLGTGTTPVGPGLRG